MFFIFGAFWAAVVAIVVVSDAPSRDSGKQQAKWLETVDDSTSDMQGSRSVARHHFWASI